MTAEWDLFRDTADYYARYRVPYPAELFEAMRLQTRLSGKGRLLDLGFGTGEITLPMSRFFREVRAVDVEPEMIAHGRAKAERLGIANVRWLVSRAEDVEAPPGFFELITIGAAFHWMDRPLIARRALEWLPAGRYLAVLGSNSPWTGSAEWQQLALNVIRKWLGEERRAGCGTFQQPTQPHEEVLKAAGFHNVEDREFDVPYVWSLDAFIGYLYSTSFASRAVLGDTAKAFEAELRAALLAHDPRGEYEETMNFYYILGERPGPTEQRQG